MPSQEMQSHRPIIDTYDSGYEYSLEHLLELQNMLLEADERTSPEPSALVATGASAA